MLKNITFQESSFCLTPPDNVFKNLGNLSVMFRKIMFLIRLNTWNKWACVNSTVRNVTLIKTELKKSMYGVIAGS